MRCEPELFGTLKVIAENDAERIWLAEWVKEYVSSVEHFLDLDERYRVEKGLPCRHYPIEIDSPDVDDERSMPVKESDVEGVALIDSIRLNVFGF